MPARKGGPAYTFEPTLGRFRDARTGRMMSGAFVRGEIDTAIKASSREVAGLMTQLRTGAIGVEQWEVSMRETLKASHTAASMVAKGGRDQMSQADFGRLGAELKYQYGKLAKFADGIADGTVRLDGLAMRRADLYAAAPRATYHAVERQERAVRGYDEEKNVMGAAEHCLGAGSCTEQTERDWVPLGDLVAVGSRLCLTRCKCRLIYRNSTTGQVAA